MKSKTLGISRFCRELVIILLLVFSATAFGENTIRFLGVDTQIEDRERHDGVLLSAILDDIVARCEEIASQINHRNPEKEAKKRLKKKVKCLRKKVRRLKKRRKHRMRIISREEYRILKKIIREFRKNGGVVIDPEMISEIDGRVTTPGGEPIVDVTVMASGPDQVTTTTFPDGTFDLELNADAEYILKFTATGFATQVVPVKAPPEDGVLSLEFTMIAQGETQTVDVDQGGTISGNDGASVTVSPGSFVDADGTLVTGNIELTITPVDVSNSAILGAFPGDFSGIPEVGEETPIYSLGTVEYEFTQNGEPLQLAAGSTAEILIPIYNTTYQGGGDILLGDTIPLWFLNEDTGIWEQEGEGTVVASTESPTGLALSATVSHFSWWNCDVSMNAAEATVTVTGSQTGTALVQATATAACNIGWRPTTVETVLSIGGTASGLDIPSSCEVCFSANINFADGGTAITKTECRTAPPNGTETIILSVPDEGPLNIVVDGNEGPITVNGVIGFPINRLRLSSTTAETTVTYAVISATPLPGGISLNSMNATQAEIAGIPTEAGNFTVEVQGTDDTGTETDSVVINFVIVDPSTSDLPVFLNDLIYLPLDAVDQYDLNPYNIGGASTNWSLDVGANSDPVPTWIALDSVTGVLSVVEPRPVFDDWTGIVRATNSAGSAETQLRVCTGDCDQTPTPIPGDYAISVDNAFVRESNTDMIFTIRLNQPSPTDISVDFNTVGGLATPDVDFTPVTGTVTIPAGSTSATVAVPIIDDLIPETTEMFTLELSNPSGGRIEDGTANGVITDNDILS